MGNIHDRIKELRKHLKMNQTDFGMKLNLSQTAIGQYENGTRNITDRSISQICTTFQISENWLRTGQGEMYEETETTLFAAFAKQYDLSEAEQKAARYLLQLSSQERQQILHHVVGLAEAITSDDQPSSDIDSELEAYRQELEAAAKGETSSASDTTSAKRA